MMLTYALTIVIATAWLIRIIISGKSNFKRTFLDIPIALYLVSHILSTIFSIDFHTSIWGYYSRFHEGLLATISYIILFYAAVSNLKKQDVMRIIYASFASGIVVSLWGMMEHFGNSPSCAFITGRSGVDCWIQDVKNRVFATLGQPNWMAAYLDVLILISLGFILSLKKIKPYFLALIPLFFVALIFTKSRSGFLGLAAGVGVFGLFYRQVITKPLLAILGSILLLIILFGIPISQLENYSIEKILFTSPTPKAQSAPNSDGYIDIGISESGDIRKIVWNGAVKVWQRYPVFGSGVETFAYAYYKDRPVEHNMVSEWDFLYNKAHNEFLNILATTGIVGMLTYLTILGVFAWRFLKSKKEPLPLSLFAAWITILVTNFFGFSVVIIGLFFFLIPACYMILTEQMEIKSLPEKQITSGKWLLISLLVVISAIGFFQLWTMWSADKAYAYGKNLSGIQRYQEAYPYLVNAVNQNPGEPTFRDELAYNQSVLALAFHQQASDSAEAKLLTEESIKNSNIVLDTSPNILSFWKTRTRLFYNLASLDKRYLFEALSSIRKASELAPTDAKVNYNYGLLLGQTGDIKSGIKVLEQVTQMKPDYADAHYALGIYYAETGKKDKAREQMNYMLTKIGNDDRATKWLEENPK